jgi:hypothetical protein
MKKYLLVMVFFLITITLSSCQNDENRQNFYQLFNESEWVKDSEYTDQDFLDRNGENVIISGNYKEISYEEENGTIYFSLYDNEKMFQFRQITLIDEEDHYIRNITIHFADSEGHVEYRLSMESVDDSLPIDDMDDYVTNLYKLSVEDMEWIIDQLDISTSE